MVDACDVTWFYAKLTFCINSNSNELFQIIFLFETTFIFPQHLLSREVCMVYWASYWLSIISQGFELDAWEFLSMAIIFQYFKCKLCCANIQNLFKNHIFVISVKNCILQLNYKAHLPVTKIQILNAKSLIQRTWHRLLSENFPEIKAFNNYFRTITVHF